MINIIGFWKKNHNKRMTIKAWAYAAWYRFLIKFKSREHLEKYWGVQGEESTDMIKPWQIRYSYLVAKNVDRVCGNTPWESKCLVRAWTAVTLLKEKEIPCTLYLGVGKDEAGKMVAHAWVRCGKNYVTGGNGEGYGVVAKFRN